MIVAMMDAFKSQELKTWNLLVARELYLHMIGMTARNIENTNCLGIQATLFASGLLLYTQSVFLNLESITTRIFKVLENHFFLEKVLNRKQRNETLIETHVHLP